MWSGSRGTGRSKPTTSRTRRSGITALPSQLAYVVIPLEIIGGIALIIGLHIRTLTVILGTELLVVAFAGHLNLKAHFSVSGFSWEYPVYWGLSMFALALLGDGVYSVDNIRFRRKGTA